MSDQTRRSIHRYFQEFGPDLGEAVYQELKKPGGMSRLLKKLGIPPDGTPDEQYKMLIQYFRTVGVKDFLELTGAKPIEFQIQVVSAPGRDDEARARLGLNPIAGGRVLSDDETGKLRESGQIQTPMGARPKPAQKSPPRRPIKRASDEQLHLEKTQTPDSSKRKSKITPVEWPIPEDPEKERARKEGTGPKRAPALPEKKPETRAPDPPLPSRTIPKAPPPPSGAAPYDQVDEDGFPIGPLIPGIPPDSSKLSKDDPAWDPNKPFDPLGTWPEVERRSGLERRRKPDRRKGLDTVFKNQRYGGDRRSPEERRKNWPKGGF